jgi:hypothetical protein
VKTSIHAKKKVNKWYIDSGCSNHMTGDKNKFHTSKEVNEGSVTFGDNDTSRIDGNCTLIIDN